MRVTTEREVAARSNISEARPNKVGSQKEATAAIKSHFVRGLPRTMLLNVTAVCITKAPQLLLQYPNP
jgi:hypothetical protein